MAGRGPGGAAIGASVKQFDAEAGERKPLLSWARRLASASAIATFALIAASGAKANVVETFNLSGKLNTFVGPLVSFTGTFELEFSNDFSGYQYGPLSITVQGGRFSRKLRSSPPPGQSWRTTAAATHFCYRSMHLERGTILIRARLVAAR